MFKSSLACNSNFNYSATTALLISLTLVACGSSDDDPEPEVLPQPIPVTVTPDTGVFLDSAVIGIGYRTETLNGVTDADGMYQYLPGETVTFFIGGLEFPATAATGVVTPMSLANSEDVTNASVINMARLLQTLDQDGDPSNGITITQTAIDSAEPVDFNMSTADFAAANAVQATIQNGGQDNAVTELIDEHQAITHLAEQLSEADVQIGIVGSWQAINNDNDLLSIVFFNNGKYVLFEVDADDSDEESGMEWGSYERDSESNRVYASQEFDENDGVGLNDFGKNTQDPQLFAQIIDGNLSFDVDEDADGTVDETLVFERLAKTNELGSWKVRTIEENENDLLMFVFYANGTYVHAEVDFEDETEESGMEWGTYNIDSDTSKVTINITFDANGDTGLTDFSLDSELGLFLSINDDILTLSFDEDGDDEIDDSLSFERP